MVAHVAKPKSTKKWYPFARRQWLSEALIKGFQKYPPHDGGLLVGNEISTFLVQGGSHASGSSGRTRRRDRPAEKSLDFAHGGDEPLLAPAVFRYTRKQVGAEHPFFLLPAQRDHPVSVQFSQHYHITSFVSLLSVRLGNHPARVIELYGPDLRGQSSMLIAR